MVGQPAQPFSSWDTGIPWPGPASPKDCLSLLTVATGIGQAAAWLPGTSGRLNHVPPPPMYLPLPAWRAGLAAPTHSPPPVYEKIRHHPKISPNGIFGAKINLRPGLIFRETRYITYVLGAGLRQGSCLKKIN